MAKITVKDIEITIISIEEQDYISLTDMVKAVYTILKLLGMEYISFKEPTVNFLYDTRRSLKDGACPVKLVV